MTIKEFIPEVLNVTCDFCGGYNMVLFSNKMRHDLNLDTRICLTCLLVQTNPQPSLASLHQFYDKFYHLFHKRIGIDSSYLSKSKKMARRRFELIKQFVKTEQSIKVLEVGPGAGQFMVAVKDNTKWAIEGIELGTESFEWCKSQGLNVENVPIEDFETDTKFDLISSFHVLEHVTSPKSFLQKCSAVLSDEGILYLEVPNFNTPGHPYEEFLQFPHLFNFTRETLTNYLQQQGFAPVYVDESIFNLTIISRKNPVKYYIVHSNIEKYLKRAFWKKRIYAINSRIPSILFFRKIKALIYTIC